MVLLPVVASVPGSRAANPGSQPQPDLATRIEARIERLVADDAFSGTVLVARGDDVLVRGAWGKRDRERGLPNQVDTQINIGSITKTFTSVAVARLVERGKLRWDMRVGEVLPDYPDRAVREHVRLSHLATHQSGVPDFWRLWFRAGKPPLRTLDDYLGLIRGRPLDFQPGSRTRYSNSGVNLLGLVIQTVTGEPYARHMARQVFEPAGMTGTGWPSLKSPGDNQARGYRTPSGGKRVRGAPFNPEVGSPSGGAFSTVDDLFRFHRALGSGKLLRPATVETITTRKVELHPGVGYGYLFFDIGDGPARWTGHDGGSEGVNAEFRRYRSGHVVIVLSNYEQAADMLTDEIEGLIFSGR